MGLNCFVLTYVFAEKRVHRGRHPAAVISRSSALNHIILSEVSCEAGCDITQVCSMYSKVSFRLAVLEKNPDVV